MRKKSYQKKIDHFIKLPHIPLDKKFVKTIRRIGLRYHPQEFEGDLREHSEQLISSLEESIEISKERRKIFKDNEVYFRIEFYNPVSIHEKDLTRAGLRLIQIPNNNIGLVTLYDADEKKFLNNFKEIKEKYFERLSKGIKKVESVSLGEKIEENLKKLVNRNSKSEELIDIEFRFYSNLGEEKYKSILKAINNHLKQNKNEEIKYRIIQENFGKAQMKIQFSSVGRLLEGVDAISNAGLPSSYKLRLSTLLVVDDAYRNFHPRTSQDAPCVCVIDSGIARDHPLLETVVEDMKDYSEETNDCTDNEGHGTAVAGIVAYGESLDSRNPTNPNVKVIMAKIMDRDEEDEQKVNLEEKLQKIVKKFIGKTRVYNLSISGGESEKTSDMELASIIDRLEREYGCIFVVSTGNISFDKIREFRYGSIVYPNYFKDRYLTHTRVHKPAEACCALTVGSLAKKETNNSIARINQASPFTRRGPSPDNRAKPDLVAHGGNLVQKNIGDGLDIAVDSKVELCTLNHQFARGLLKSDRGTSFSAPLVSRVAAQMFSIYKNATPNLIKALIINSALISRKTHGPILGHGEINASIALSSIPYRATYILESDVRMDKEKTVSFRVPKAMQSINGIKRIYFTLVYDPLVDHSRIYYTLVDLELRLVRGGAKDRQFDNKHWKFRNLEKHDNVKTGIYEWHKGGWREDWRVYIKPYHCPIISKTYSQKFALVVTLEDPTASVDLYNEILSELRIEARELERTRIRLIDFI